MSTIHIKDRIPLPEHVESGHLACPGCAAPIAMRLVLKALGPRVIVALPSCCWSIVAGPTPRSALKVPFYHTAFTSSGAVASGIKAALEIRGDRDTTVMAWAGDGGTVDIGLQALSGAAERNEDILYCCYDNESFLNEGILRSSATPWGTWSTTTDGTPESRPKADILAILAAHRIPYAATASVAYPADLIDKVTKAKGIRGTKFLHILSPCPPGWKTAEDESVSLARMAVQNRIFPLLEIENGDVWRFTIDHPREPVAPYLRRQGRFLDMTDEAVERVQAAVDQRWRFLERRVEHGGQSGISNQ